MHSLRARLIVGVLGLTAVGLLVLGGITYAEQRSFQLDRVDSQAVDGSGPVATALVNQASRPQGGGPGGFDDDDEHRGHGPGPSFGPPPGTYGQLREMTGAVLLQGHVFSPSTVTAKPDLPASVPLNRLFNVDGQKGANTRYRVYASRVLARDGGQYVSVVAIPLREVDQNLRRLLFVEGLVIAGVLLALAVAAWAIVRVGLLPLDRMGHTAGAIAGGDLSHRIESTDPRTEVGRLGIALNAMLDRLERAFALRAQSEDRLRRFIADASHELRTPLASIRGYAELHRMGAATSEADTEKAMRRIEEEATRMGVLVEDLLMLARLDQLPEVPHTDVDLAALARDAGDDARATAPERPIEVETAESAIVLGDAHQLRQILANLLRNALVHTPEGSPIEVTVERAGEHARLEVRDHGPGLPTDDAGTLFERFWRAEGGRERGRAGAGLGLAIVAAIVDAHGGEVEAENARGGGASFVVRLPLSDTSQRPPTALRRGSPTLEA
jgi:two-component system OmpR family sensor kinase